MLDGALDRVGFFADCEGLAVPKWEEYTFQYPRPLPSISGISDLEGNFNLIHGAQPLRGKILSARDLAAPSWSDLRPATASSWGRFAERTCGTQGADVTRPSSSAVEI